MLAPFMPCGAKLPVIALFAGAFFGDASWVGPLMYFMGIVLIFLGALLTGLGVYDKLANIAGAGTLVPITGFANAVVSPALEFKTEGYVTGTAAKMFIISGPVIVFGLSASVVYGVIYWIVSFF